jgi:hypothetical protein
MQTFSTEHLETDLTEYLPYIKHYNMLACIRRDQRGKENVQQ